MSYHCYFFLSASVVCVGESCEEDLDGCADNSCTAGTNCTDLTPQQQVVTGRAFNCSACPGGYEEDDGVCVGTYLFHSPSAGNFAKQPAVIIASDFLVTMVTVMQKLSGYCDAEL